MNTTNTFPTCFPNKEEHQFLRLVLSSDTDFPATWESWKSSIVFDDIDHATLRIMPFLFMRMQALGVEDPLFGRIKGIYRYAWCKNQGLLETARVAIQALHQENIPVLLLKGVPLLLAAYQNTGARFSGDVDLLVHPKDAMRAMECLHKLSVPSQKHLFPSSHKLSLKTIHKHFHEQCFKFKDQTEVDLHWQMFRDPKKMSADLLWKQAIPLQVRDVSCLMPCPEDLLIHVIVHGTIENTHRTLRWVIDATTLIRNNSLDWQKLLEHIQKHGRIIEMQTAFRYLSEELGISVPAPFLEALYALPVHPSSVRAYFQAGNTQVFRPFKLTFHFFRLYLSERAFFSKSFLQFLSEQRSLENPKDVYKLFKQKVAKRVRIFIRKFQKTP